VRSGGRRTEDAMEDSGGEDKGLVEAHTAGWIVGGRITGWRELLGEFGVILYRWMPCLTEGP